MGSISNPAGDVGFRRIVKFEFPSSSAEYVKPPGLRRVRVTVVGKGGDSGSATASSTGAVASGGGGGGGCAVKIIEAAQLAPVELVNVGTGLTSFGAHCSATAGGASSPVVATSSDGEWCGASGGVGIGGDLNFSGGAGTAADFYTDAGGSRIFSCSGIGGVSVFSGNAVQRVLNISGLPGGSYGAGASGAMKTTNGTNSGGGGAQGVVIIEEFY